MRTLKGIIDEHMPDAGPSRAKNVPEGRKRRSLDAQTESKTLMVYKKFD